MVVNNGMSEFRVVLAHSRHVCDDSIGATRVKGLTGHCLPSPRSRVLSINQSHSQQWKRLPTVLAMQPPTRVGRVSVLVCGNARLLRRPWLDLPDGACPEWSTNSVA